MRWIALALVVSLAVPASAQNILPPAAAPGVVATTDWTEICVPVNGRSYSRRHRKTTAAMRQAVRLRDGAARCGEIDHRCALSLGCADVAENLWCEVGPPEVWNFRLKDALEEQVWWAVCRRRTMTPAQGQAIFLAPDWRPDYCRLIGGPPCPP